MLIFLSPAQARGASRGVLEVGQRTAKVPEMRHLKRSGPARGNPAPGCAAPARVPRKHALGRPRAAGRPHYEGLPSMAARVRGRWAAKAARVGLPKAPVAASGSPVPGTKNRRQWSAGKRSLRRHGGDTLPACRAARRPPGGFAKPPHFPALRSPRNGERRLKETAYPAPQRIGAKALAWCLPGDEQINA